MASPANKKTSSSPPIPNRPNPKPRNSEVGDPMRRSFGGNPFPANSRVNIPSDLSRRNSFGGREDKENETKPIQTPKTSKHFMSPTISAVSKINSSPRKKVLSDKNELPRSEVVKGLILEEDTKTHRIVSKSCVSFSDVVHEIVDIDVEEKKKFEGSSHDDMTVTDFDHENEVHDEEKKEGIVYSDPRFMISPRSSVPYSSPEFAASGEVDDTLAPYDPKKNFLSPRPQFLHYRPNPRIEKHFDECKQLEELFISEGSSSDTELSVEESANSEEQEEVASHEAEAVVEEEETVEQLEAESDEEMVCESVEETSKVPKQSGSRKFKFLGLFLALALGYMLVSATPIDLLKESPFYEFHIPREVTEFAKAKNLEKLSEKLWTLTESSLVIVDKLVSRLGGGTEEYGPLKFHNLTYNLEDHSVFQPTSVVINEVPLPEKSRGENNLEDRYDNEFEQESGGEEISEDGDGESIEFEEETEMELNEGEGNLEALLEDGLELNTEQHKESEVNPEEKLETGSTKKDQEEELEEAESEAIYINLLDVESAAINVHQQKESEVAGAEVGSEEGLGEIAVEAIDDLHLEMQQSEVNDGAVSGSEEGFEETAAEISDDLHRKLQQSEVADAESVPKEGLGEVLYPKADAESVSEEGFVDIASETSDDLQPKVRPFVKEMIVLASTVLVLLAGVGFLFAKKTKPVSASAPKPAPQAKELNLSHLPVENLMKEQLSSSLNFLEEEVDDRVSKISFHSNKNKDSKEHQSEGENSSRNLRRESMASSASEYSVGSFSYGSFTTYEKIPIKSGDREEEMITPVRRSSRLRNHKL
uniref:Transmembrane protein n=1 Tax=Noccaea caerulescens TaxID=107243 RepID=A0A1J3ESQ3_NOCCA